MAEDAEMCPSSAGKQPRNASDAIWPPSDRGVVVDVSLFDFRGASWHGKLKTPLCIRTGRLFLAALEVSASSLLESSSFTAFQPFDYRDGTLGLGLQGKSGKVASKGRPIVRKRRILDADAPNVGSPGIQVCLVPEALAFLLPGWASVY